MNAEQMICEARAGGDAERGLLFDHYRNYLRLLARVEVGRRLQRKLDESDLVQEAMLDAHRHFDNFRGTDERQFVTWLRRILAGKVSNLVRHFYGTRRRDLRLEEDLEAGIHAASRRLSHEFADSLTSPSQQVMRREQGVLLADAMEKLRPDYREVLVLRHLEGLTFPEVAKRMKRTQDSVEKLWLRALAKLRHEFETPVSD